MIDPRLIVRLRKLFLESCIDPAHFDRRLSLLIDAAVIETEK